MTGETAKRVAMIAAAPVAARHAAFDKCARRAYFAPAVMNRVFESSFEIAGRSGAHHHHRGHHAHVGAALPDATVFCSKPRE